MNLEVRTMAIAFLALADAIYLLSEWAIWQPTWALSRDSRRQQSERH